MVDGMNLVEQEEDEEDACLGMGFRKNLDVQRLHDMDAIHTEHRERRPRIERMQVSGNYL